MTAPRAAADQPTAPQPPAAGQLQQPNQPPPSRKRPRGALGRALGRHTAPLGAGSPATPPHYYCGYTNSFNQTPAPRH